MRGLHKLNGAANTAQARRDYAWLLNLAAQHDAENLIPSAGERPGWRAFDKAAKAGIEALLKAKPELRNRIAAIYPGFVADQEEIMSMTKRYLESLPKEQQDDILGLPPAGEEWYDSAEWMTDERKSRQFMGAMDLYFERIQAARMLAEKGDAEY